MHPLTFTAIFASGAILNTQIVQQTAVLLVLAFVALCKTVYDSFTASGAILTTMSLLTLFIAWLTIIRFVPLYLYPFDACGGSISAESTAPAPRRPAATTAQPTFFSPTIETFAKCSDEDQTTETSESEHTPPPTMPQDSEYDTETQDDRIARIKRLFADTEAYDVAYRQVEREREEEQAGYVQRAPTRYKSILVNRTRDL
jgi:hypothetical protein